MKSLSRPPRPPRPSVPLPLPLVALLGPRRLSSSSAIALTAATRSSGDPNGVSALAMVVLVLVSVELLLLLVSVGAAVLALTTEFGAATGAIWPWLWGEGRAEVKEERRKRARGMVSCIFAAVCRRRRCGEDEGKGDVFQLKTSRGSAKERMSKRKRDYRERCICRPRGHRTMIWKDCDRIGMRLRAVRVCCW